MGHRFIVALLGCILATFLLPQSEAFVIQGSRACVKTSSQSGTDGVRRSAVDASFRPLGNHLDRRQSSSCLAMTEKGEDKAIGNKLQFILDPGTKGGAVFLSLVLFVVPVILYNITLSLGVDLIDANRIFGVGFTVVLSLAWVSTYIFRVATKDMTYVRAAVTVTFPWLNALTHFRVV
jgi:hypothetical protein